MSYELADAHVEDMRAAVWRLTKVTFTGAAILLREKAAYGTDVGFVWRGETRQRSKAGTGSTPSLVGRRDNSAVTKARKEWTKTTDVRWSLRSAWRLRPTGWRGRWPGWKSGRRRLTGDVAKIVATVDATADARQRDLERKLEEAEQQIAELKAQAAAANGRKTLPVATMQLLAKQGIGSVDGLEAGSLDAALTGLSLEQRVAVKAQLIRAGALA